MRPLLLVLMVLGTVLAALGCAARVHAAPPSKKPPAAPPAKKAHATEPWLSVQLVRIPARPSDRPPSHRLLLATMAYQSCMNHRVPASSSVDRGRVRVRVGDVRPPAGGMCLTALGPARGEVDLGPLPPGTHRVELVHRGLIDRYRLVVATDGVATLHPVRTRFTVHGAPAPSPHAPVAR